MNKTEKHLRLTKIKLWEAKQLQFLEIVIRYNAEFGTNHFSELFSTEANHT